MEIETPVGWRKGQTIFNFLWWLNSNKKFRREFDVEAIKGQFEVGGRMADPFYIPDDEFDALYKEFLLENTK